MILKKLTLVAAIASALLLSGCDDKETTVAVETSNSIKVGVIAGPEQEIAEFVKERAKELYNLDVELITFNDYVIPNQALSDGLIDLNVFQHKPFLDAQIEARNYKLTPVANTFVYPIASYSYKLQPLTEDSVTTGTGVNVVSPRGETYFIPAGATIAIPNDPTNLGRSLLLLEHNGLITLDSSKGLLPNSLDIIDNPYNYKILELEAPQLPRSLKDPQVTLAVINTTYAGQEGLSPLVDGIFVEDKESPYVNIIVARDDNKDAENVKTFIKTFNSDEVAAKADQVFDGGVVKGW